MTGGRSSAIALGIVLGGLAACGGQEAEPDADADGDTDADGDADVEDGGAPFEFDFFVFQFEGMADDLIGEPLAGVAVAVDLPAGREELVTGADGSVHVSMPAGTPDVTLTAAKVGWLPVTTIYKATVEELEQRLAEDGRVFSVLTDRNPAPADSTTVTVTSTGSPTFAASVDLWEVEPTAGTWQRTVNWDQDMAWDLVAYSTTADGCPVELYETTFPDLLTDRNVEIPFDGTGSTTPEQVDVTILLPDDPLSPFRNHTPYTGRRFPVFAMDDGAHHFAIRGGSCAEVLSEDGSTIQASVQWFPAAGRDPIFFFYYDVNGGDWTNISFSYQVLPGPLTAGTYRAMDTPHLSAVPEGRPTLASRFTGSPVEGGNTTDLIVVDTEDHGKFLWLARSFRVQEITLPALPAGYDRAVDWPTSNLAQYRVRTCESPAPIFWAPYGHPETCSASALLYGNLE